MSPNFLPLQDAISDHLNLDEYDGSQTLSLELGETPHLRAGSEKRELELPGPARIERSGPIPILELPEDYFVDPGLPEFRSGPSFRRFHDLPVLEGRLPDEPGSADGSGRLQSRLGSGDHQRPAVFQCSGEGWVGDEVELLHYVHKRISPFQALQLCKYPFGSFESGERKEYIGGWGVIRRRDGTVIKQ